MKKTQSPTLEYTSPCAKVYIVHTKQVICGTTQVESVKGGDDDLTDDWC